MVYIFRKRESNFSNKKITHHYLNNGQLFGAEVDFRVATVEEGRVSEGDDTICCSRRSSSGINKIHHLITEETSEYPLAIGVSNFRLD